MQNSYENSSVTTVAIPSQKQIDELRWQSDGRTRPQHGAAIIIQTSNPAVVQVYQASASWWLGLVMIVMASMMIITNFVCVCVKPADFFIICYGIWGSIMYLIAGPFAMMASSSKSRCAITATMVLSIVAVSLFGAAQVALCCTGVAIDADNMKDEQDQVDYYCYDNYDHRKCEDNRNQLQIAKGILAGQCLSLVMAVVAACAAIWCSTLGCRPLCCNTNVVNTVEHYPVVYNTPANINYP